MLPHNWLAGIAGGASVQKPDVSQPDDATIVTQHPLFDYCLSDWLVDLRI